MTETDASGYDAERMCAEELREAVAAERRPLSNLSETAGVTRIREAQFVGDAEMAEILNNDTLVRRLKTGSRQARLRKDQVVEQAPESSKRTRSGSTCD